jgi:formyl-CoA transferase
MRDRLPLARITVLDLTLARAGPTCVRHLADWGASVIRVEPPSTGDEDIGGPRDGPDFQNLHRNKRAIRLDLKAPDGHAAFMRLAARADVIVENMRAQVKHRLRIAYDDIRHVNPRLVYGSISGFGQDGPYAGRPGVDQIAQGLGGLMSITGLPGQGPVRVGIPIADLTAGNLLAFGIMTALFEREATGVGRWVTTSLLEAQVFMLDFQAARWLMAGEVAGQAGNDHPTGIPTGVFPASDGPINLAASSGRQWARFCEAIGRPEWLDHEPWQTQHGRSVDRAALNAAIGAVTREQPVAYWVELLTTAGIPCGPINSIDRVFADPQVEHLGIATSVTHPRLGAERVVASPLNLSGVSKAVRSPAPDAGADTEAVLREVGYGAAELADMRARGVI